MRIPFLATLRRASFAAAIVLGVWGIVRPAWAQEDAAQALATVNGDPITQVDLIKALTTLYGDTTLNHLINTKLLDQEVRRRGLAPVDEEDPEFQERAVKQADGELLSLARARGYRTLEEFAAANKAVYERVRTHHLMRARYLVKPRLLAERILREEIEITPEKLRQRYEAIYGPKAMARQIVLKTKAEAERVRTQLESGADFIALATEHSIDPVSRQRGGLMEPLPSIGTLGEAAFELNEGEVSGIIGTDEGFHILKVEQKVPARSEAYEDVKEQLRELVIQEEVKKRIPRLLLELRQKSLVTIHSDTVP